MKTIRNLFIGVGILFLGLTYNQTSAYTPDFSDFEISSSYSSTSEKLDLRFELEDVYDRPSYPYFIKIKINDRTYTSNLVYSSSSEKLYSFFSISIDKDDVKSYYYMNYYIINNDNDSTKYYKLNHKVDIALDTLLKWSNLKLSSSYDENSEELKLVYSLSNIAKAPSDDYYIKLKINNKNYESEMIYDTAGKKLYAFFDIDIDENILKSYYYIDYSVINDDKNSQVYSKNTYKLDTKTSTTNSLKEKLTWSNMKITNTYNKDQEYVKIAFNITNIKYKPKENYYIKLDMGANSDSIYTSDLIYDAQDDKLSTIFYIDTPRRNLKSYYYIKYYVYTDKEVKAYSNSSYKLNISNYSNYSSSSNTYYYNNYNNNYNYISYDNFDWEDLGIANSYNYSDEKLKIDLALENITTKPGDDYQIKFYIDGKNYTKDLYYSSSQDELYSSFYINIDKEDIENAYYVYYYIYNKDAKTTEYSSSSKYIYINNYRNNYYDYDYNNNNYNYNNDDYNNYNYNYENDAYKYAWDKINVIEANHYNNTDRRYYLNQEIDYLENNRFYDSSFKSEAINILEDRIDRY